MSTNYGKKYTTARDRVLLLLDDGQFHSWSECKRVGGVRYSARILELKRLGCRIVCRELADHGKEYRLVGGMRPQGKQVRVYLPEAEAEAVVMGRVSDLAKTTVADALASFRANRHKL